MRIPYLFLLGLSPTELINLLKAYDKYVTEFPDTHDESSYPVCLEEFYENDYEVE